MMKLSDNPIFIFDMQIMMKYVVKAIIIITIAGPNWNFVNAKSPNMTENVSRSLNSSMLLSNNQSVKKNLPAISLPFEQVEQPRKNNVDLVENKSKKINIPPNSSSNQSKTAELELPEIDELAELEKLTIELNNQPQQPHDNIVDKSIVEEKNVEIKDHQEIKVQNKPQSDDLINKNTGLELKSKAEYFNKDEKLINSSKPEEKPQDIKPSDLILNQQELIQLQIEENNKKKKLLDPKSNTVPVEVVKQNPIQKQNIVSKEIIVNTPKNKNINPPKQAITTDKVIKDYDLEQFIKEEQTVAFQLNEEVVLGKLTPMAIIENMSESEFAEMALKDYLKHRNKKYKNIDENKIKSKSMQFAKSPKYLLYEMQEQIKEAIIAKNLLALRAALNSKPAFLKSLDTVEKVELATLICQTEDVSIAYLLAYNGLDLKDFCYNDKNASMAYLMKILDISN